MSEENKYVAEAEIFNFLDQNGNQLQFNVIAVIECGKGCYLIASPLQESEDDIAIFEIVAGENGEALVEVINDIEWSYVAEAWEEMEDEIIILLDDEGNETEFLLIVEMEVGESVYLVITPLEVEEDVEGEEDDIYIVQLVVNEEGEFLSEIEDDLEWELVFVAFEALFESEI